MEDRRHERTGQILGKGLKQRSLHIVALIYEGFDTTKPGINVILNAFNRF